MANNGASYARLLARPNCLWGSSRRCWAHGSPAEVLQPHLLHEVFVP